MKKIIICFWGLLTLNVSASNTLDIDAAVRSGDVSAVSALLDSGVDPSLVINEGRNAIWKHSPLILAVKSRNVDLVNLLIKRGAEVNYVNVGSTTALKEAAINDDDVIAALLIAAKSDVSFVDENEVPILFWAVSSKSEKVIPLLVQAGADPDREFNSIFYGKHTIRDYFSQAGKSDPSIMQLLK